MAAKKCPVGRCTKINTKALALCIFIIPSRSVFVNSVSGVFFVCFPREATFFRYTDQLFLLLASMKVIIWKSPSKSIISCTFWQINRVFPFWQSYGTNLAEIFLAATYRKRGTSFLVPLGELCIWFILLLLLQ